MSVFKEIKHALSNLRPEEVRKTADRSLAIGLVATSSAGYTAMEKFLAPPDLSRERRAEVLSMLHRAGDPGIPERFDLVLYEHQLPRAENAFTFYAHDPIRTVNEILEDRQELGLSLARRFFPFRRPVVNQVMYAVSRENAMFALATALPNIVPSLVELPWVIGEFASDTAFLTMNQIRMAFLIAAASDSSIGYREQKAEIASIITGALGFRAIARELVGKIPFGDQAAPKWYFPDQLPCDSPKTKRAGNDRGDLRLLFAITDRAVAGCGNQERHADLVHREEGCVTGELADHPGQFDQARNDVWQRRGQREHRILARYGIHHLIDNRTPERKKAPRQRQSQFLPIFQDLIHRADRIVSIKGERVLGAGKLMLVQDQVKTLGNPRISGAVQHRQNFGPPLP